MVGLLTALERILHYQQNFLRFAAKKLAHYGQIIILLIDVLRKMKQLCATGGAAGRYLAVNAM
jgi:hypothetical protein